MKTAVNGIAVLSLCAFLLAGGAWAEAESAPAPTAEPATQPQPFPGIIVNPPRPMAPAAPQPQSCPDSGRKLELIS